MAMAKENQKQYIKAGILIMIKILFYLHTIRLAGECLGWK